MDSEILGDGAKSQTPGTPNKIIFGTEQDDTLNGDAGDDKLYGEGGNDAIHGEAGNDSLIGGDGNDTLFGGSGADKLIGGEGKDVFFFEFGSAFDDIDIIKSFNKNEDSIDVSGLLGSFDPGEDDLSKFIEVRPDGYHTVISVDPDGTGQAFTDVAKILWVGGLTLEGMIENGSLIAHKTEPSVYEGTEEADTIGGSNGPDIINGNAGNDKLVGGNGKDTINGGEGNDLIFSGNENDLISGDAGNDKMFGENGNDVILGGAGEDSLNGNAGDDTLIGGEGTDYYIGGSGSDLIVINASDAFTGVDQITSFSRSEGDAVDISDLLKNYDPVADDLSDFVQISRDGYHSIISVNMDGDGDGFEPIASLRYVGGLTLDSMVAGGNLIVPGVYRGTNADDVIDGGDADNVLLGRGGNDKLVGDLGNDIVHGGSGEDTIFGGIGRDTISGDEGADKIFGDQDNDLIFGGEGDDSLNGGDGDDFIYGGKGSDLLVGNAGADTFFFTEDSAFDGVDVIKSFSSSSGDAVDVSDLLSNYDSSSDDIADFLLVQTVGYHTSISVDWDGGGDSFVEIASLLWVSKSLTEMLSDGSLVI